MSDNDSQPTAKRPRTEENGAEKAKSDLSGDVDLSTFVLERLLSSNTNRKSVTCLGSFTDREGKAVVLLEKKAFCEGDLTQEGVFNKRTVLKKHFDNDVYGNYEGFPKVSLGGLKITVISPANDKLIAKYTQQPNFLVQETPALYKTVTLPFIESDSHSIQWVYNILDGKSEADRIVYSRDDPDTGFVLLPDLKWDGTTPETLYLICIVRRRGLKSIRDLTAEHLPLLKAIRDDGEKAILDKYGLRISDLRVYLHYQPSYYHLHVHFTSLRHEAPGISAEKSHILHTVIDNIELMSDYYQKATLPCSLREGYTLHTLMQEAGAL